MTSAKTPQQKAADKAARALRAKVTKPTKPGKLKPRIHAKKPGGKERFEGVEREWLMERGEHGFHECKTARARGRFYIGAARDYLVAHGYPPEKENYICTWWPAPRPEWTEDERLADTAAYDSKKFCKFTEVSRAAPSPAMSMSCTDSLWRSLHSGIAASS